MYVTQRITFRGFGCARNADATRKSGKLFDSISTKERVPDAYYNQVTTDLLQERRRFYTLPARKAYPVPVTKQVLLCTSLALYPSAVHSIQELLRVSIEQAKWTEYSVLHRRGKKRKREKERPARNWIYRCEIWFDSFSSKRVPESPRYAG